MVRAGIRCPGSKKERCDDCLMLPSIRRGRSPFSLARSHNLREETVFPTPPVFDVTMIMGAVWRVLFRMISPTRRLSIVCIRQNSWTKSVMLRSMKYSGRACAPMGICPRSIQ